MELVAELLFEGSLNVEVVFRDVEGFSTNSGIGRSEHAWSRKDARRKSMSLIMSGRGRLYLRLSSTLETMRPLRASFTYGPRRLTIRRLRLFKAMKRSSVVLMVFAPVPLKSETDAPLTKSP